MDNYQLSIIHYQLKMGVLYSLVIRQTPNHVQTQYIVSDGCSLFTDKQIKADIIYYVCTINLVDSALICSLLTQNFEVIGK